MEVDGSMVSARYINTPPEHFVQEIAYQLGYITPSHFIKLFKLVSAMTPAQYRQKITQSGL
ncbi:helix-turn-helix domain-containing protein [Spirosoma litoris]